MRPIRPSAGDVALAVALVVIGIVGTGAADAGLDPDRPIDALGFALVVGTAGVLLVRRRWPLPTLAAATVLTAGYLVVGYTYGPILFSFFVAVYTVARLVDLAAAAAACLAAVVVLLTHLFTNSAALPGLAGLIPGSAWVVTPFTIGVIARLRNEAADASRAELVRERVADERLRVAREVHDVVGHGLAAIKMHADIGLHLLPKRPEQAEAALTTISRTSTEALAELRATLAVVRRVGSGNGIDAGAGNGNGDGTDGATGIDTETTTGTGPDTVAPRSPAPGLGRLEELCQRMREAGVDVRLTISGPTRPVSAAVDLAGYRVVQESLTNVLRHSATKQATVRVAYESDALVITVTNPATAVPGTLTGLGIPGMRERVQALGGRFSAGPGPTGTFEVRAGIPTEASG